MKYKKPDYLKVFEEHCGHVYRGEEHWDFLYQDEGSYDYSKLVAEYKEEKLKNILNFSDWLKSKICDETLERVYTKTEMITAMTMAESYDFIGLSLDFENYLTNLK